MKILVTPTSFQDGNDNLALKKLQKYSNDIVFNETGRPLTELELMDYLKDCDGFIAGLDNITKQVIESTKKLKVISRYGAGVDRIDLKAANSKGIVVTNTPGANSQAVAELVIGLMFAFSRNLINLNNSTKRGEWVRNNGLQLEKKILGIVGFGSIGRKLAKMAMGIGMNVISYDPFISKDVFKETNVEMVELNDLFEFSDFISFHLPLNDSTYHLVNKDSIAKMKNTAVIINTSRGGIINEADVTVALKQLQIGGLCLDVFEVEPPKKSPLFHLDNVIVTPHTGAHTAEAKRLMGDMAVDNLLAVLENQPCENIVM